MAKRLGKEASNPIDGKPVLWRIAHRLIVERGDVVPTIPGAQKYQIFCA